jgi:hypothetical protein
MIRVFAGTNKEVNEEVRAWLAFHGFFYYPCDYFIKQAKVALGGTRDDLMVVLVDDVGNIIWRKSIPDATWKVRDEMYRIGLVAEDARID